MAAFHILADPPLQVVLRAVLSAKRPHKSEPQLLPSPNLRPINDSCTMLVLYHALLLLVHTALVVAADCLGTLHDTWVLVPAYTLG